MLNKAGSKLSCPHSWYAAAYSHELPKERSLLVQIGEEEILLFRSRKGVATALNAICPHMGANMWYGGRVVGDSFKCPFHGLTFNSSGKCCLYGEKDICTKSWPVTEMGGIIFIYYGPLNEDGIPPWKPPNLEGPDWTHPKLYTWPKLTIHPQELLENAFDLLHFNEVHGFHKTKFPDTPKTDGHTINNRIEATIHNVLFFGLMKNKIEVVTDYSVYGLGMLIAKTYLKQYDLTVRSIFMTTPLNKEELLLRLHCSINKNTSTIDKLGPIRYLPKSWLEKMITALVFRNSISVAQEDFIIWNNRRYLSSPHLTAKEGAITVYRDWAKQFYA